MKTICCLMFICCCMCVAGRAQDQGAEAISLKIATKMTDSLALTGLQKDSIYKINLLLHTRKAAAWQQYAQADSLRAAIQRIENTRDSLYRPVLTPDQYGAYRTKKRNLVSNN